MLRAYIAVRGKIYKQAIHGLSGAAIPIGALPRQAVDMDGDE
jgi:hypothetical protein